jgi:prevent-host-death family protein
MKPLQLQEAKQQFSAVADKAAQGMPQVITKHGKPYVVIVGVEEWQKTQPKKKTVLEALQACPADLGELDLERSDDLPREIGL